MLANPCNSRKLKKDITAPPLPQLPTSFLTMLAQIVFIVFVNVVYHVLSAMNTIPFLDNSFGEGLQEGKFCNSFVKFNTKQTSIGELILNDEGAATKAKSYPQIWQANHV
jgi:hypothetical protein